MEAAAKAERENARESERKDLEDVTTMPASMARFLDAVRNGKALGGLVAWTAGGRHLVGELVKFSGDTAIVARTISAAGARPEMKAVALDRLRPATADGPEAKALVTHHKYGAQQRKWLEWHDKRFDAYCPTTYPDASYTKDFTLTSEIMLRTGRAHVIPDGLIRGNNCQIYTERVENRFGKVVQLRGYKVSRLESWPFATRAHHQGQLPRYGHVIAGQDGRSYVVTGRHAWHIRSQLSPGERVRLKKTGEEQVIKGTVGRSQHGDVVYVLETGGMVLSLDTERVDTAGDRIVMDDEATREAIAAAATSAEAAPAWVARVLPQVEALTTEYKASYEDEYNALTQKDHRERRPTATNPNIWTHLAGVVTRLKAGDYDEAVEELGTMVGMGRGIGHWVGGDAAEAIKSLIASVRAEVANKHARTPSEAEMVAAAVHLAKARYLRLEGMGYGEALRNDRAGCGPQVRLDLVKADDPAIHPPIRAGQYTVFLRDGQLYARQWNAYDGFHDRAVSIVSGEPFGPIAASTPPSGDESMNICAPDDDTDSIDDGERSADTGAAPKAEEEVAPAAKRAPALSNVLESWKAIHVAYYLPFERWEAASYDAYALMQLIEQKVTNGSGAVVSIKAIRLNGRLYASTGGTHHGLRSYFTAWELVPEASFRGETTTTYHDEAEIQIGKRERGDHRGLIVMHRGQRYVFDRKIEVHATLPSPSQAVGIQEVFAHDEQDPKQGWRSEYGPNDIEWKQLAGFTVGVFTRSGQVPQWMLYYRDLRGNVRSFYLPEPDALPAVRASDVGNEEVPMAGGKKRGSKDYGYTLCGEQVTNCIDETCNAMRVDWADREILGQALSRDEDPATGNPIATPQRRTDLKSELEHLDLSIGSACEYLAQFVEGEDDMGERKRAAFKRGDAVIYYGATGPKRMWWGAKMYAYRILASDPANLDAGLTIKEEEVGRTVFPAPNEHGVYVTDDAAFTTIEFRKQRSYVLVAYLQIGPEQWVSRYSYNYGSGSGSGPAHIDSSSATWLDAIRRPLVKIIAALARSAATDTSLATRRFAKDAMLGLLAQVPTSLQTTIINQVRNRRTGG